jgi:hypothetical protein
MTKNNPLTTKADGTPWTGQDEISHRFRAEEALKALLDTHRQRYLSLCILWCATGIFKLEQHKDGLFIPEGRQ